MPIVDEEDLRTLLDAEKIGAFTLDTSIFDEKKLQLSSNPLQAIAGLKGKLVSFILSGTVAQEVRGHIETAAFEVLQGARREIGKALFAFGTENPTRDELIDQITGGLSTSETAEKRFGDFVTNTGCEVLDDTAMVDVATLFEAYFGQRPPFGPGKKKSEFPDALALNSLEKTALARGISILVVSKDGDWTAFCKDSQVLYLVSEVEKALDLISKAPLGVRNAIKSWAGGHGRKQMYSIIERLAERVTFSVNGHATHGELEAMAWTGKLTEVAWCDDQDIDVIEIEHVANDHFRATISLPLWLTIEVPIELSFSIWDSFDRESVGISGRSIEVEEEIDVRATFTLDVYDAGTEDEAVDCDDGEIDVSYHEIDLGEVDVFDRDDYDHNDRE